jgi:hypothetical protein
MGNAAINIGKYRNRYLEMQQLVMGNAASI